MTGHRISSFLLKLTAVFVILLGAGASALHAYGTYLLPHPTTSTLAIQYALAGFYLVASLSLGAALIGLSTLSRRSTEFPPEFRTDIQAIRETIEQLSRSLGKIARPAAPEPRTPVAPSAPPAPPAAPLPFDHSHRKLLARMVKHLAEIRQLTLLNDEQKQARLLETQDRRKAASLRAASQRIEQKQWAAAESIVARLESRHPADPQVTQFRVDLNFARHAAEESTFTSVKDRVEDLMSLSSWDDAIAAVTAFMADYPAHAEGRNLLDRVIRERHAFQEAMVSKLYDEFKHDLERRNWRRALAMAQRLLEKFPDSPRCAKIRAQLRTIQDNAEIEERQELEMRIQELLRAKRFPEAISIGEDLLRRFPRSPQADAIEDLMPKMREMAKQAQTAAQPVNR